MSDSKKIIQIQKDIYDDNDKLAAEIKKDLATKHISLINILGTPGCGKTTFLINICNHLKDKKILIIEGDLESDIDTVKLTKLGIDSFQINTHGGCHLDAVMVEQALASISDKNYDVIFIENVGNLICTNEYDLGETKRILLTTVTEGSDKPYKYPYIFEKANAVIINKSDLIPYVEYDEEFFTKGVRLVNKKSPIFKLSSLRDEGIDQFTDWLGKYI